MTRLGLLGLLLVSGCLADDVSREEFDAVLARLDALESPGRHGKKHRGGHGGDEDKADAAPSGDDGDPEADDAKPKGKGPKGEAKSEAGDDKGAPKAASGGDAKGSIEVEIAGDAASVSLMRQRTRFAVPGPVPQGQYSILATFDGEEVEAGSAKVGGAGPVKISCKASAKKCQVR